MGLISVDDLKALVSTSLDDEALQGVIDREEAYLARRIGPLVGERTERFAFYSTSQPLRLQRPTDAASVATADPPGTPLTGVEVITDGWRVWRPDNDWPYPGIRSASLYVTYTPNDEDEVTRVLIELCRMSVAASSASSAGLRQESMGQYSYATDGGTVNRSGTTGPTRGGLVRSLRGPAYPSTTRVRSLSTDPWVTYPPLR